VQTERAAHEAWAALLRASPRAAELLHLMVARMGEHNAVVMSHRTMAQLMGRSRQTVMRALAVLSDGNWIETRQIGERGTVCAYIVNDRVAWQGRRDGMRYSLFSAAVVVSAEEQPDKASLGAQEPLRALPSLFPGERQLPTGNGLPPPSEPDLPGMEPDLPARSRPDEP
jgi:DNA-binding transcriptional MocR family regulator